MITIDYTSRLPLYEQIVERFQMLIIKGILPSGSQMPSVRALAVDEKQNRCKADLKELVSHARELDISEEECHRLIEEIYHTEVSHD